jgi:hypothetical protein
MRRSFQQFIEGIKDFCTYFQVTQTLLEVCSSALGALAAGALVQNLQDINEEGSNNDMLTLTSLAAGMAGTGWLLSVCLNQYYFRHPQYQQRETQIEAVAREVMRMTAGIQIMQRVANYYRYNDFTGLAYIPAHFVFSYGMIWGQHQEMLSNYDGSILPWRRRSILQDTCLIWKIYSWILAQSIEFLFWFSVIDLSNEAPLSPISDVVSIFLSPVVLLGRYLPIFWGQGCKLPTRLFFLPCREHLFGEFSDHWQRAAVREAVLLLVKPLWILPVYQFCLSPRSFSMLVQQGCFFFQGLAGSIFFLMGEKRVSQISQPELENKLIDVKAQALRSQADCDYTSFLVVFCSPCMLVLGAVGSPFAIVYFIIKERSAVVTLARGIFATIYESLLSLSGSLGAGICIEGLKRGWERNTYDYSDIAFICAGGFAWLSGIISNYLHRHRPLYQHYSRERWIETLAREFLKITVGGQIILGGFAGKGIVAAYLGYAAFIYGIIITHDLELQNEDSHSFLPWERRSKSNEHNKLTLNPYSKKDICIWLLDRIVEISIGFAGLNRINEDNYIPKPYTTAILTLGSFWVMRVIFIAFCSFIFYADSEVDVKDGMAKNNNTDREKMFNRLLPRQDITTLKKFEISYLGRRLMIAIPMNVLGFLIYNMIETLNQPSTRNMIGWRQGLYFIQGLACFSLFVSHEIKRKPRIRPPEPGGSSILHVTIMPPPDQNPESKTENNYDDDEKNYYMGMT